MIDHKHFVVTLMAIFIALALGIFIGNALLGDDLVIGQQQEIINRLEKDYYILQEEYYSLQEQLSLLEKWQKSDQALEEVLLSGFEQDSLGIRVAVVTYQDMELQPALVEGLENWGTQVDSVTTILGCFCPENQELMIELANYGETRGHGELNWTELVSYLAGAIVGTRTGELMDFLADRDWISFSGDATTGVDVVLFLGGSLPGCEDQDAFQELLIKNWKKEGVRVIVGENKDSKGSRMEYFRQLGIPTITHLDTLAGRLSLIYLLNVDQQAHFGYGPEAEGILPQEWLQGQVKGQ